MRPALLPVAKLRWPGAGLPATQLHRRGLQAAAQVQLWTPRARGCGGVDANRGVEGEEVHLEEKQRLTSGVWFGGGSFLTDHEGIVKKKNQPTCRVS